MKYTITIAFCLFFVFGCRENEETKIKRIDRFVNENKNDSRIPMYCNWTFVPREYGSFKSFGIWAYGNTYYLSKDKGKYIDFNAYPPEFPRRDPDTVAAVVNKANIMLDKMNEYEIYVVSSFDTNSITFAFGAGYYLLYGKDLELELRHTKEAYPGMKLLKEYNKNWALILKRTE